MTESSPSLKSSNHTEDLLTSLRGRIAIVGNATPKHNFGELIDGYDTVIRLNNFRTAGFEKLIGSKTDFRCTTAWHDIEHRNENIEFSPFTALSTEAGNLKAFNEKNLRPVLAACMDVHPFIPETPKPSAGLALVQLCSYLEIPVDLFGFDGFKTPHYWDSSSGVHTTHSRSELDFILQRPGVLVFGETYPYQQLYDFCHANHSDYDVNVGLELVNWLKKDFRGLKALEFGSGNGDLARHLESKGNKVTSVEASLHAFERINCTRKIHGTALALPFIKEPHDIFVSVDVLEHLTENDVKLVIREAARLCRRIFVSVCTRPSGLLGPNGENLHLTVRPPSWWARQFGKFFRVQTCSGYGSGQFVIEGERIEKTAPIEISNSANDEFYVNLFIKDPVWSTPHPNEDEAARWEKISGLIKDAAAQQPDGKLRTLDVGCGRGWLTQLASSFGECEGVEPVAPVVAQARKLFPQRQFTVGTPATILNSPNFQPYDLIVTSEVIEHVPKDEQPTFAQTLFRLLRPGGHVILTTPRGEAFEEWTRLAGDPSQPVEDWLTEPQLREVFVREQFTVKGHQRVLFDKTTRRYGGGNIAESENQLPIYQIWSFQKPAQVAHGKSSQEAARRLFQSTVKLPGYSFCIITNGKRPQKLAEEIASIRALGIPQFEILVGGEPPDGLQGVRTVPAVDAARGGRLGEMRNRLTEAARYDHLVIADDDLLFQPDFFEGLKKFGEDYEVLCVRFLNADGTRYWDWATVGGPRGHELLDYDETDPFVYVTGGLCTMKASVAERVKWNEACGFYQGEDVDFSARLRQAGVSIKFNRHSSVVHTDARYTQHGKVIMTAESLRASVLGKMNESKWDEARALFQRLQEFDPAAASALAKEVPALFATHLKMPVRWRGPIFNPSGYASEAINFILPLSDRIELGIFHQNNNYSEAFVAGLKQAERARLFSLRARYPHISGGIVIEHNPANAFQIVEGAAYRIGRTMFETDRISPVWVIACNQMDEVWVPSQFNVETFATSGVERDKLRVIPEAVDEAEFDPAKHTPLPLPNCAGYNFLSIFEWSKRKGWDVLLAAYLREFSAADDVCLHIRTYLFGKPDGDPRLEIEHRIQTFIATLNLGDKALPRISILAEQVAQSDLPRLYKAADCLVAPSRGEGWGRPHHEAMLMALPVIATKWSGNTEFMNAENSYLIDSELVDTTALELELRHYRNQRWAEPSEASLRQALRRVFTHRDEAKAKGQRARQDMLRKYSRAAVADLVVARLQEIQRKLTTPALPVTATRKVEIPARSAALKGQTLRVTWEGTFLDFGSLSHVNRELTGALAAQKGIQLARVGSANSNTPEELKGLARRVQAEAPKQSDVTVRHAWPPKWQRPTTGAWVLIQPWEYGVLPMDWAKYAANVDEIWAPSEYVRRVYVDSGVHPEKVKIVPNGIDPAKFRPDLEPLPLTTKKTFRFLFVGGTIQRKGPDVLLKAYLDTFTAADDVCLVIKDFGGQSIYEGQTLEKQIVAAQKNPNAPEILYLTNELPAGEIPRLYAACQCLVHPYRGEGFGLPVLEAMACGLVPIVTAGGATDDFATSEFAYRLPALRAVLPDKIGGLDLVRNGWWLEPQAEALRERMKWVADHRDEVRALGRAASDYVRREWTWERAAQIAHARLDDLIARKQAKAKDLAAKQARKAAPIALPNAARIGNLTAARELLTKKDLLAAWRATVSALQARPYHPEAHLLLAEIAQAVGDGDAAQRCAQRAKKMAPGWDAPKQFIKAGKNSAPSRQNSGPAELIKAIQEFDAASPRPPRLTVCMIVKNEEKFLGQCLESIKDLASQIVVVDTGSTDQTVAIAKEHGAEVYHFAWTNDFSAARNAALEHATGDWILSLDADEELLPEHKETLRREMQAPDAMAYRLPIIDKGREQEGCSYVPRLFRSAPGLFFLGRVHEQAFSSIHVRCQQWSLKHVIGQSALLHHGYTAALVADRNKIDRNLRLLELAIEELPNEPNLLMNYGLELVRSGNLREGIEQYYEALRCATAKPSSEVTPELRETLLTQLTTHLLATKNYDRIVALWQTPFAKTGAMTASQHFGLGLAYMELKEPAPAAEQMRQCLAKREMLTLSPRNPEILKAGPAHCLALCLATLQQHEAAAEFFRVAMAIDPKAHPPRFDFARFLFDSGKPLDALKVLNQLLAEKPADLNAWLFGGQIALSKPEFRAFACDWTAEAIKHFAQEPPIILQRAEALFLAEKPELALAFWGNPRLPANQRSAAARLLCEILTDNRPKGIPASEESAISQEALKWYRRLIAVGAVNVVQKLHQKIDIIRPALPGFVAVWEKATRKASEAVAVTT